jgi:hypothetical protein
MFLASALALSVSSSDSTTTISVKDFIRLRCGTDGEDAFTTWSGTMYGTSGRLVEDSLLVANALRPLPRVLTARHEPDCTYTTQQTFPRRSSARCSASRA